MIKRIIQHRNKIILLNLALLQVFINFASNFMIVKKIGFGNELDIYYIAMAVFSFLSTSIGWSISSVLTPILIENREDNLEGKMFLNVLIITIPIFFIAIISMFFWSKLIFVNYIESVEYSKILIIQGMFIVTFLITTLNVVFYAIFQEKNQYIKINFLNMFAAIIGFTFVYLTIDSYGVYSAVMSQVVMQLFLFIIMLYLTFKIIKKNFIFDKEKLLLLWNRMKYIFIGSFYYRTDELIERFIASYLTAGFLSLVGFIQRVYGAIITVLNTSIAGPTITKFSTLIKDGHYGELKKTLYNYLIFLFLIDLSIFLVVLLFGENLFLYFFSDKIDEKLLPVVYNTILLLFTMIFGKTLGQVLHNLLLSLKLEKTITLYDSATFTINIFIKVLLTIYYGMFGFLISIVIGELIKNTIKYYLVMQNLRKYNAIEV